MKNLPNDFCQRMKNLLGERYEDFIKSYDLPPFKGIRVNTLKMPAENAFLLPFELEKSPFAEDSFFLKGDYEEFGTSPFHHCGAFYSQEPPPLRR